MIANDLGNHRSKAAKPLLLLAGLALTLSGGACGDGSKGSAGEAGVGGQGGSETVGDGGEPSGGVTSDAGAPASSAAGVAAGGATAICGDGIAEQAECEPPGSALCSDDCVEIATSACLDCEQASACYEFSENCLAFEGEERTLCYDVHECVAATSCGDGERTLTSCFCGELATSACLEAPVSGDGSPMGPCADIIRRSMGQDASNSQVLTRYINVSYPGGGALARMNCDKVVPECLAICGF